MKSWTTVVVAGLVLGAASAAAGQEALALYEDWRSSRTIRLDRWRGQETGVLDIKREIRGNTFEMRTRREGGSASDAGLLFARHRLTFTHPLTISVVEATLDVRDLELLSCATNPIAAGTSVAIFLNKFNDGSGGPGNMTGDYLVNVNAARNTSSLDPDGVLSLHGGILRCNDATCSNAVTIRDGLVDLPATALVGDRFSLRVAWDPTNSRFLVGAGNGADVPIPYPPEANQQPAGGPFADIRTQLVAPNCTSSTTVADITLRVHDVKTNASAIVP